MALHFFPFFFGGFMDLSYLAVAYGGGLLALVLKLRNDAALSVATIAKAVAWPLGAARDVLAIVLPTVVSALGYVGVLKPQTPAAPTDTTQK